MQRETREKKERGGVQPLLLEKSTVGGGGNSSSSGGGSGISRDGDEGGVGNRGACKPPSGRGRDQDKKRGEGTALATAEPHDDGSAVQKMGGGAVAMSGPHHNGDSFQKVGGKRQAPCPGGGSREGRREGGRGKKRVRFIEGLDDDDSPGTAGACAGVSGVNGRGGGEGATSMLQLTGAFAFKNTSNIFSTASFKPHPGTLTSVCPELSAAGHDDKVMSPASRAFDRSCKHQTQNTKHKTLNIKTQGGVPVSDKDMGEVCRFLSRVPKLQGCGSGTLREIAKKARVRKVSPGSLIVQAPGRGEKTPRELFFLTRFDVRKTSDPGLWTPCPRPWTLDYRPV